VAGRPAAFWAQALHAEGARLLQAKRFAQAGEVFQRLAVLSRGRLGHHGLGAALAGLGRREEAAASLRQELAANPGNQAAQRLLDQIAAPAAQAAAL
jgi:Flp pilus assembly protein TadD